MTSTRLWSGPDTTSFKSISDSDTGCCQLTPISVTPLVPLGLKKNSADRNGLRGGACLLGVRVAGAKTRECSLSQLAAMRTRQLHLARGPVLLAPQFALLGTRLATGRDQIIRDVHYCGILEQSGPAVTHENDVQVYARGWVRRRVRPPLKDLGRPRRRTHPRHFCGSLPSRIWTL